MTQSTGLVKKCVKCGFTSHRINGKNWQWDLCSRCAKQEYYMEYQKTVTCRKCGAKSNHRDARCWKQYGLCGKCVKLEYPSEYPSRQNRPSYYKLCPYCNELLNKVLFQKRRVTVKTGLYACSKCVKIYDLGSRFKIEEYNKEWCKIQI